MRNQKNLFNWNYSNNRQKKVTNIGYPLYDWIEFSSNYREGNALGWRATAKDVMKNITTSYTVHNHFSNTTWDNGVLINDQTGRMMQINVNDKGILKVKVCPPKYINGNNVQEATITEILNLFTALSDVVGYDLGNSKLQKVDITHTAVTEFKPECYFPMLCNQKGEERWMRKSTLYYGSTGKKQKKFYDKVAEVNQRKTYGGKQRMPEEFIGKNLTRFEVSLGTHGRISKVLGEKAKLGHLFTMEGVEKLHNYWLNEYELIPKETELNINFRNNMGKKLVKEQIIFAALSQLGRTTIEEALTLAGKTGAVNKQELYKARRELLLPFKKHATKHDLIKELDKNIKGFDPIWE